jgi:hypothetical protein
MRRVKLIVVLGLLPLVRPRGVHERSYCHRREQSWVRLRIQEVPWCQPHRLSSKTPPRNPFLARPPDQTGIIRLRAFSLANIVFGHSPGSKRRCLP